MGMGSFHEALRALKDNNNSSAAYVSLIQGCTASRAVREGRLLHAHIIRGGHHVTTLLANLLVRMYGRWGHMEASLALFTRIRARNTFSWNTLISAYAQNGHPQDALLAFLLMQQEGLAKPDRFTFSSLLSLPPSLPDGKRLHACLASSGLSSDLSSKNALITFYGQCRRPEKALAVFDSLPFRDPISWNAMIAAYSRNGLPSDAVGLFVRLLEEGLKPNRATFLGLLDTSGGNPISLADCRKIHECISAFGFGSDVAIATSLLKAYGDSGSLKSACDVFERMSIRDSIAYTSMISLYSRNGYASSALTLFKQMSTEGAKPSKVAFLSILDSCADPSALANGREIHHQIEFEPEPVDIAVENALITMYGKCGSPEDALMVFRKMPHRDIISWTAAIVAYALNGHNEEALELYKEMDIEISWIDNFAYASILDVCANLTSLVNGRWVHARIIASGILADVALDNALLNMYGKCGSLKYANALFKRMGKRNVISWTTMITSNAQNGHGAKSMELFEQMLSEGPRPNDITFLGVMSACSHTGLVEEGRHHFASMSRDYGIVPSTDHYACMIDLLGRAGILTEAEELIGNMPTVPPALVWNTLLGGCRIHGDVERASRAAKEAFRLDPMNASTYLLLSDIYASVGRWSDAARVRKAMVERGAKIEGTLHGFFLGKKPYPMQRQ